MNENLVSWNDGFSVGSKTIDAQHKELIAMTNDFYSACQRSGSLTKFHFLRTIQGAVNYAKNHFATEEEIMRKAGYPDFEAHQKQHKDFVAHVMEQVREFERAENPDSLALVQMLLDWILDHVMVSDKKYAPYIKNVS